jgi:hypothetical protein
MSNWTRSGVTRSMLQRLVAAGMLQAPTIAVEWKALEAVIVP